MEPSATLDGAQDIIQNGVQRSKYTFIVEHLDPELETWSSLEYSAIAQECHASRSSFILSSVPKTLQLPPELRTLVGSALTVEHRSVEDLYASSKEQVCLLDPKAATELSPCDAGTFSAFLFGGILGDDPPRDRTGELRAKGFPTRRLGPVQMTTDTAVRVTRMVVLEGWELEKIPYVDFPEIKVNKHESVEMPFRYVLRDGKPVMPEGMRELILRDSERGFGELF
jgi:ribosome biogenesis SPOUT family RNA methylase Rps3